MPRRCLQQKSTLPFQSLSSPTGSPKVLSPITTLPPPGSPPTPSPPNSPTATALLSGIPLEPRRKEPITAASTIVSNINLTPPPHLPPPAAAQGSSTASGTPPMTLTSITSKTTTTTTNATTAATTGAAAVAAAAAVVLPTSATPLPLLSLPRNSHPSINTSLFTSNKTNNSSSNNNNCPFAAASSSFASANASSVANGSKIAAFIRMSQQYQDTSKPKLTSTNSSRTMGGRIFQRRSAVTRSNMNTGRRYSTRDNTEEKEKVARSIFGDVPLTGLERRFLTAATDGNLAEIKQCIMEGVNVNCRDYLGRTALQLALQGDHYDATKFLLDHCTLDVIEEGLLHAIKLENVRICDMFLNHPVYADERNRRRLEFQHGFYEQDENNSNFSPDITPIVLAAQCNNFDIVHMLLRKGFSIDMPHHYFCLCTECDNHKRFDRFVHSRSRLNAYRGLASTAYMALSSDDPVLTAFELSEQLKGLEEKEKEHKSEYKSLCDHCKNYAVELLELCRTNEEVMAALHGGSDIHDLSRVRMAIKYEQKKFIAHASCQEHLMSIWYAGVPWFQHQSFMVKLFIVPLGILFIPVTAIIYVFLPYSKLGEILRSPFMKFMNYMCSYMAFLVFLLIATTSKNTTTNSEPWVVRGFIIFYVFGMFWAECKQLWDEGVKEYFAQMWNYMDITMLALYTASYTIESIVSIKSSSYNDTSSSEFSENLLPNPRVLALVLFSVANVLSFARIAYILPASETFGQLQISYGRMLQDVFKFICIYFTVMIAFICGLTSLYSYSGESNFQELLTTFETLFWAAFGMGNPKAPKSTGKSNHLVETVGNLMYGVYIIGAVVVLINMLIAMMSNTFEEIQDDEDVEWKFARAKLWISFIDGGGTLPVPFNIIPTPKSILKIFIYLKKIFMRYVMHSGEEPTSPSTIIDYEYKSTLRKVVLRYIHKMKYDKKGDVVRDDIFDTKEEIVGYLMNVFNKISNRMESIENSLVGIDTKLAMDECNNGLFQQNQNSDFYNFDLVVDGKNLCDNNSQTHSPPLNRQPKENLSDSRQSFTTEVQYHGNPQKDWYDRSLRFGSSKSDGRPNRTRKQMDSVTENVISRSVPLHSKYFSHEV
ncbi:short transient receptor potential channel 3-like [Octopus vulgaris]|uniref:Short transient receptor potential channel 3-like n=1 Tax=Octopus vulgaris TaxID=6645 RepID=A0AA36FEH8_OCTVU|nr:short transient receptor potential channel 3-like [Octopus vulgaris]